MPTRTFPALHGWRRCGKRSIAPRATPKPTIWNGNRWFSRCSGCFRRRRARRSAGGHPQQSCLNNKGICGGEGQEKSCEENLRKAVQEIREKSKAGRHWHESSACESLSDRNLASVIRAKVVLHHDCDRIPERRAAYRTRL